MNETMNHLLETMELGPQQTRGHVTVFPVLGGNGAGPDYLTLQEAMEAQLLTISEISEGGAVPELKVSYRGERPLLLLDGEELAGAKQNRVLNTTILLKEQSETIIPVSCTEQGRWFYRTHHFHESGNIMSARLRRVKNESVAACLRESRSYHSDQGAIWEGIRRQSKAADIESPTSAMEDIHQAKREDLESWLGHFTFTEGQKGLMVLINGIVAGLDLVSRSHALGVMHPKLMKSYLMDAILETPRKRLGKDQSGRATSFLKDMRACTEQQYDSPGYGRDYRYQGSTIVGSALVHDKAVIHLAFFTATAAQRGGSMSSLYRRRSFRLD